MEQERGLIFKMVPKMYCAKCKEEVFTLIEPCKCGYFKDIKIKKVQ